MTPENKSQKNLDTPESKSRTSTSAKKRRYKPAKDPIAQLHTLAGQYSRHGSKESHRKRLKRLEGAVRFTTDKLRNNDLRQIGKRHVHIWYEHLIREGMSEKTLMEYFYAWCLLWSLLCRPGEPPRPCV